jgi:hypothetical protein
LSEPITCHVDPFLKRMNMSPALVFARSCFGNASSIRRLPVLRVDRVPDRFAALLVLGQHVPVIADALMRAIAPNAA